MSHSPFDAPAGAPCRCGRPFALTGAVVLGLLGSVACAALDPRLSVSACPCIEGFHNEGGLCLAGPGPTGCDADGGPTPPGDAGPPDAGFVPSFTEVRLPPGGWAYDLKAVPGSTSELFAVVALRIFRSTDQGDSWTECPATGMENLEVWPLDSTILVFSTPTELWASFDACQTRTPLALGTAANAVLPLANGGLLAGVDTGLRRLATGSTTWQAVSTTLDNYPVTALVSDLSGQLVVAASVGNGIARSTDGGQAWASGNTGLNSLNLWDLSLCASDPSRIYALTDTGISRSDDSGASWRSIASDGAGALAVSPENPDFVLQYMWNSLWESWNGGDTWFRDDRRSPSMTLAAVNALVFPAPASIPLLAATNRGLFRTSDYSNWTWTEIDAGINAWAVLSIAVPGTGTDLFLAATGALLVSDNGGNTWIPRAASVKENEYSGDSWPCALAFDPASPGTLFMASGSQLVRVSGGGASLALLARADAVDQWEMTAVAVSGARIFAGTGGRLFFSGDAGSSWSRNVISGQVRRVNDILLLDSLGTQALVATSTGLFLTSDDGASFSQVGASLASQDFRALAATPDLHLFAAYPLGVAAASDPRGAWTHLTATGGCDAMDVAARGSQTVAVACLNGLAGVSFDQGVSWSVIPGMDGWYPMAVAWAGDDLLVGTLGHGLFRAAVPP